VIFASPSHPQERSFSDATQVTVVEVPVQVVHRGEPVRGLRAEDFRIFDEGEPRTISSFERIDLAAETAPALRGTGPDRPASAAPPTAAGPSGGSATRRHLLLFFDLAFSRPEDLARAERAARELVENGLHPSDLVGVTFYSPRAGASLVLRFTSDHDQVLGVLEAFRALLQGRGSGGGDSEPRAAGRRRIDPLGLTAGVSGSTLADLGRTQGEQKLLIEESIAWSGPFDGIGGGLELNKLLNTVWHQQQQIEDRRSGDVADLAEALAAIARATAGIAGPKHLVMFSRGFDVELLHVKTHGDAPFRGAADSWFTTGGGSWILTAVDSALEELRRAGWSIQAIELAGTTAGWNWNFREGLFFLADETGGALYENTNDPGVALEEMIERTAVTYLLSFQVADLPEQPELRRLRVEVDGLPRGARLIHRAAYERPRPWSELPLARRRAESAEALLAGEDRDHLGVQVLALPVRDGHGGWSVPVAVEVDGLSLLAGDLERTPGAEIYVYAFDAEGAVADLVAHRVDFRRAEARGRLTERGLKFLADLSLPAGGRYRLRFLVRSLRNGETALRTVPVELPVRSGRAVLLPPLLVETDTASWVITTEVDPGASHRRRPFTLHGRAVTPALGAVRLPRDGSGTAATASGASGDRLGGRILILGYGLGNVAERLRATVFDGDGRPAGEVRFLVRAPEDGAEPDLVLAALPAGLAPGAYTVQVSLAGADGTVRGRTAARFRLEEGVGERIDGGS
jgi:VWFA-related protein